MVCSLFLPPAEGLTTGKSPLIVYLSGLTCTDENATQKGSCFGSLTKYKCAMVFPDTSPRGYSPPLDGDSDSWDFGIGAGFYLDATAAPWATNFNMYSYITKDLPAVLGANFNESLDLSRVSIMGHSMGGHGALTVALKNQDVYTSVSAFAPICNPINCQWGVKAFTKYLGEGAGGWQDYDATELIKHLGKTTFDDILLDVGTADVFHAQKQLLPEAFIAACEAAGQRLTCRMRDGYDHGYFFVATFMEEHIKFHADRLHA